jgi:hypothetical protein
MVPRVDGLTRVVSRSARSCAIPQSPPLTSGLIRVANLIDRERRRADWLSFLPAVRSGVEHALACSACLRKAVRMVEGGGEGRVGGIGAVDEGLVLTRKLWLASSWTVGLVRTLYLGASEDMCFCFAYKFRHTREQTDGVWDY